MGEDTREDDKANRTIILITHSVRNLLGISFLGVSGPEVEEILLLLDKAEGVLLGSSSGLESHKTIAFN
jgi:hypothetical protein